MQLIMSLLLAITLLLGNVLGFNNVSVTETMEETVKSAPIDLDEPDLREKPDVRAESDSTERAVSTSTGVIEDTAEHADVDYKDMKYSHYETSMFFGELDEFTALADEGDADGVISHYEWLYDEFVYLDTIGQLAMIRHDADIYDEYWADEYSYVNDIWLEMGDAFCVACKHVLETDAAAAFEEYIGSDAADYYRDYDPMTEALKKANERELELVDEYYALYDTMQDDITYSYGGQDWSMTMLNGYRGDTLYNNDYDGYFEVYYGLQQKLVETFAPIYIELVEVRTEIARESGYDNYIEYAYKEVYNRSYTPEDAQVFCDAMKPLAAEYYDDLYYSDLFFVSDEVSPAMNTEEIIETLGEYLPRISESLLIPYEYMTKHGLYDIAESAPGRNDGGYTTSLASYGSEFIYLTLDGSCYDFISTTHEYGHFCNFHFNPLPDFMTDSDDLDLDEIHSNGLQALFTEFYGEIFDDGADIAEFINLGYLFENVLDGCLYDEFQRRVYEQPEGLTAEKLNSIYMDVCNEYGQYDSFFEPPEWSATWVYISHNFDAPLYYISYAASAIAALQIWDIAQSDYNEGVRVYLSVLAAGDYEKTYFEVLEECGLRSFAEEGSVSEVLQPVMSHLEDLDYAYRHR